MKRSAALALLTSALADLPSAAGAQDRPKVRVGANAGESLAEGLYLWASGFLTKAGIDSELITLPNGGAMTQGIVSGAVDIAPSNIASIAAAHVRGLQLNLFAPSTIIASSSPATTALVVMKDSPIRSAKDLIGKTIALSTLRDLQQAAVMAWLDKSGVDSKLATFVEIVPPEMMPALVAKRVDATMLVEPFLSDARDQTRNISRPYDALASRLMTFGWIANKDWYEKNQALIPRVVTAIRQTAQWANRNHAATAQVLSKYANIPIEHFSAINRQVYGEKLDPAMIQPIIDAAAHYGFLPHNFPAAELFVPNVS
jgi:NitT/TauT family transport system substrate-binding protein